VFLGDSITQGGDYVTDFECWLISQNLFIEVVDLGLSSETASDLTEAENAPHVKSAGFGRPMVSERLDRALAATKPDLLIACYGMNDGDNLPPGEPGTKRFGDAITHLRDTAMKSGVKRVVICTPPVFDPKARNGNPQHEENIARYASWLLTKKADGWDIVDIHGPMLKALEEGRAKDPKFKLANDGVHPGREGHWLMASSILSQFVGANLDGVSSAEQLFKSNGSEIRKLVNERRQILFAAWMTKIGHKRPGAPGGPGAKPGLPLEEANAKAAEIGKQISAKLGGGK
jgi:lysophospholipase L1-like esterase